ncbi:MULTISPECIES: hypothetical protein [Methanobacterium]|jgi:hypothetical protein|uniref:Uncharacterized protein n=1 Tax=Methanobacterium spitsbergense TaxID=2874285 RepID=A0A8T5UPA2_9EURY|nr:MULTISPECIES: hypothetical protein [Methanobacterium]MBZ2165474.1 hypothetical protein [Methanobacterium spitsbergense]
MVKEIVAKLNDEKNIIKIENTCTGTFLLLNKEEALKLKTDLNNILELME